MIGWKITILITMLNTRDNINSIWIEPSALLPYLPQLMERLVYMTGLGDASHSGP